jgi:hypothetical protein
LHLKDQNNIDLLIRFRQPKKPRTLVYQKGGTEIESIYLVGDFSVHGGYKHKVENGKIAAVGKDFTVVDKTMPSARDVTVSGYPFFVGSMTFERNFNWTRKSGGRLFFEVENPKAIVMKARLNNKTLKAIVWHPYIIDVTRPIRNGVNNLRLEIIGSLRNLLGPHHNCNIYQKFTGPSSFNKKEYWVDGYTLVPFGTGEWSILEES